MWRELVPLQTYIAMWQPVEVSGVYSERAKDIGEESRRYPGGREVGGASLSRKQCRGV